MQHYEFCCCFARYLSWSFFCTSNSFLSFFSCALGKGVPSARCVGRPSASNWEYLGAPVASSARPRNSSPGGTRALASFPACLARSAAFCSALRWASAACCSCSLRRAAGSSSFHTEGAPGPPPSSSRTPSGGRAMSRTSSQASSTARAAPSPPALAAARTLSRNATSASSTGDSTSSLPPPPPSAAPSTGKPMSALPSGTSPKVRKILVTYCAAARTSRVAGAALPSR
mmetsp:Transcript_13420/g.21276  ORF Transcript_13420/g.21276 Transcript_13420/m.21276 type:complete len:229 (+) Transcript_13420:249-935(+)